MSATDCFVRGQSGGHRDEWDGTAWAMTFPPPDLVDGDVIAFRNGTAT